MKMSSRDYNLYYLIMCREFSKENNLLSFEFQNKQDGIENKSIKIVGWHLTDNLAILISIVGEDLCVGKFEIGKETMKYYQGCET